MTTEHEQQLRELIEQHETAKKQQEAEIARQSIIDVVKELTAKLEIYEQAAKQAQEVNEKHL